MVRGNGLQVGHGHRETSWHAIQPWHKRGVLCFKS